MNALGAERRTYGYGFRPRCDPVDIDSNHFYGDAVTLTREQLAHLGLRLHDERRRALRFLNNILGDRSRESWQQAAGDVSAMPSHPADVGTDTMDAELDASNATRASRELAEIDAALERLHDDPAHFGRCEETGVEILFARLAIIPWARTCRDPAE